MRQFAGFGTAEEVTGVTATYQTGEHRAFSCFRHADSHGLRLDDPRCRGEVGRCGVAIDSWRIWRLSSRHSS